MNILDEVDRFHLVLVLLQYNTAFSLVPAPGFTVPRNAKYLPVQTSLCYSHLLYITAACWCTRGGRDERGNFKNSSDDVADTIKDRDTSTRYFPMRSSSTIRPITSAQRPRNMTSAHTLRQPEYLNDKAHNIETPTNSKQH